MARALSEKEKSQAVWGATPAGSAHAEGEVPGTKDFFLQSYRRRANEELPFLHEIIPFSQSAGKKVLEVGCGVGYDAYEFCSHGAVYTGIDLTPENPKRCRDHLRYFGFTPGVLVGDAENLPCGDATMDIVFSNGVLHHTPDIEQSFREAHRVLKPQGEFWVILYHKHSVFHWITLVLVDHLLLLGFLRRSYRERLSMIEYTTSTASPLVNVYSRGELQLLLSRTGFLVKNLWVRKLTKVDFPNLPLLKQLWALIPQRWMNWLGARWGWYLIAEARKENPFHLEPV